MLLLVMAYRSFGRFRQASTHLDTPPFSIRHHPDSAIAPRSPSAGLTANPGRCAQEDEPPPPPARMLAAQSSISAGFDACAWPSSSEIKQPGGIVLGDPRPSAIATGRAQIVVAHMRADLLIQCAIEISFRDETRP